MSIKSESPESNESLQENKNEITLQLELGDIIQIFDPQNEKLNEQVFIIDYIDSKKMILINTDSLESVKLKIDEDGSIGDGTIRKLVIKSRSDESGYARQHDLLPNKWINIYFGGDLPVIMTGEITNLENDMIEIKTIENDTIYINFDYKGIPEDLPIDLIEIREKPTQQQIEEVELGNKLEELEIFEEDEKGLPELIKEKNIQGEKIELKYPIEQVKTQFREFIIKADEIKFGNEVLGPIVQYVDIYGKSERYSIETQLSDLLDELLSTVPNSERTSRVLNNIHIIIERFKQLREKFSSFDEYGNVKGPLIYKADYRPLISYFDKFNTNLLWILPIVKNIKKTYIDQDLVEEETYPDIINIKINEELGRIEDIQENYKTNNLPNDQNKYSALYKDLNPYFTPFDNLNEEQLSEILIEKPTMTDINVIIDNLGDFYSTVFRNNSLNTKRFLIQKYNLGLTKLDATNLKGNRLEAIRVNLTESDDISLKSIITLPEPVIRFSQINLPGTNILTRANLNEIYLNYWQLLKKNTFVETITVDEVTNEIDFNELNFVNNIKNYVLNLTPEQTKTLSKQQIYDQFIDKIIPKTRILFNLMKKYIIGKLSIVDVVSYLEPFMVYSDNLTYMQYKEIISFINEKISEYNKKYIERSSFFMVLKNTKYSDKPIPFLAYPIINILETKNGLREKVFNTYDIEYENNLFYNSEILRKLIIKDESQLYFAGLSLQNIPLTYPEQFTSLFEVQRDKISEELKKEDSSKACKNYVFAKMYYSMDELLQDNDKTIYFDKIYDQTNYGLIDDYEKEIMTKSPDDFMSFLINELKKKLKIDDEEAEYMSDTLISGYKKVLNNQYAILNKGRSNGEEVQEYFLRKNNKWVLDSEFDKTVKSTDSNILCNLQEKCISNTEKNADIYYCETLNSNKLELQKDVLKDIINEFDNKYFESKKEYEEFLNVKFEYLLQKLPVISMIQYEEKVKYNNEKYKLACEVDLERSIIVSPFAKYRDLILGQKDFVKKQHDTIRFAELVTRPAVDTLIGPLGLQESKYWLYCKETNVELLPTFKVELANYFINNPNTYNDYVDSMIKNIKAVKSDDGDKWVDIHTGYTIKFIDFDVEEGYEAGFKVSTRSVLEEDLGNKLVTASEKDLKLETPETRMISNIINTLSIAIGINIDYQKVFIINNVVELISTTVPKEEDYKKRVREMANKGKTISKYEDLYNRSLLYYTFGMFLIALQTSIPSVKSRKTFPGCVKSLNGYPFDGSGDFSSLNYIACIAYQIRKNNANPWYVLKGSKGAEDIASKIKAGIDEYALNLPDVKRKIDEKIDYLLTTPIEEVPREYDVVRWSHFLPPLIPFKLKNLVNISPEFKRSLLENLKSGSHKQQEQLLVVYSKIIQFSLGIQEKIYEIVKSKDLILKKINNELFLENSCCDEKNGNTTISYFENMNSDITAYNEIVKQLSNIIEDVISYTKSSILYTNVNTKNIYPPVNKEFGESTIYLAFIKFCHFRSLIPIPVDLLPYCNEKPENLLGINESTSEVIKKLKENGREFNLANFLRVFQIISKNNIININIDRPLISSLRKLLELIVVYEEKKDTVISSNLRELLLNSMDTFSIASTTQIKEIKDLNNFLIEEIDMMKLDIIDFINRNKSKDLTKKVINNIKKFINSLANWSSTDSERNKNKKISNDSLYNFVNFFRSFIKNFVFVFPNIILNKVNYKENYIPKYLGLSRNHENKIKDFISGYYEKLRLFYDNHGLINILQEIQKKCKNLVELAENTPSFSSINNNDEILEPIFNERTSKFLYEYYFLCIVMEYIKLSDDENMIVREVIKNTEIQDIFTVDYLEEVNTQNDITLGTLIESDITLLKGNKKDLKQKVSTLLVNFFEIMSEQKEIVDISYEAVLDRVFKLKEKEKDMITDRLKNMTDEVRNADTILKINKLGVWSKGLQKGLTTYVKETYDDEREFVEQMLNYERKAMKKGQEFNETNKDIILNDFIEDVERENEIELEAYDISGYTEDYLDGEFEGDEVEDLADYDS